MRRQYLCFAVVASLALALAACDSLGRETYRYRITVEVDTPQGVRSGSNVWEVSTTKGSGIPDRSLRTRVRGEAVPVDLPGGTVFALMRGSILGYDYADRLLIYHLSRHPQPGVDRTEDWDRNVRQIRTAKPAFALTPDEYPMLVRFADKSAPASVEEIEPDRLPDFYGSGVKLKRITVAVTAEEPSSQIGGLLPWVATQRGALERCRPGTALKDMPLKCRLTEGDFIRSW